MLTNVDGCRILKTKSVRKEGDFMEDDKLQQMNDVYNKLNEQNRKMLFLVAKGMEVAQNQKVS